jgi:hypothetical protein
MVNSNIINSNCWIAYFDILGFRNIVENFDANGVLYSYREVLKEIRQYDKVKHKFFSDSFVFYTENDSQDSFGHMYSASTMFFREMFAKNIPLRGCLTVGQFYVDEEEGIFFGRALIEAYDWAEGQNWIGLVLSEKAKDKLSSFKTNNDISFLDSLRLYDFLEYEVPYKKRIKRNLLVYNLNIDSDINAPEAKKLQCQLWNYLISMEGTAKIHLDEKIRKKGITGLKKCMEYRNTIIKYRNTKDFLLCVYPTLKERVRNKNHQVHYES